MTKATDVRPVAVELYFLPVHMRVPLKFGRETVTSLACARVRMHVADRTGRAAEGWGEVPLMAQWAWPSDVSFADRNRRMQAFCARLAEAWTDTRDLGHPIEIGYAFLEDELPALLTAANAQDDARTAPMPRLAALVCCSAFDVALHDAYGVLHQRPVYETYGPAFMGTDLASFLTPASGTTVSFEGKYPRDYLVTPRPDHLRVWHLVGGLDPLERGDLQGDEPQDEYPVLLRDWIERDGLKCLKIKLRGIDAEWDYARIVAIGRIAIEAGVEWLTADFNCTVSDPSYVNEILDRLKWEYPRVYGMILYVEQPFPYDLAADRIDVHSLSARKPLFMDESANDWRVIRLGRELGWTGVALKTCKTQTGALLSLCWAKAHGMALMVQDLTNPMLALIPHVLLAAHAGTIMGVEANAMQFYPQASLPEEAVHPGLFRRRNGNLDLTSLRGPGFGYCVDEIDRQLPPAAMTTDTSGPMNGTEATR